MRLLLDTHALLWWLDGDRRLSLKVRRAIANKSNGILVSAASAWEITTKARLGKLPGWSPPTRCRTVARPHRRTVGVFIYT